MSPYAVLVFGDGDEGIDQRLLLLLVIGRVFLVRLLPELSFPESCLHHQHGIEKLKLPLVGPVTDRHQVHDHGPTDLDRHGLEQRLQVQLVGQQTVGVLRESELPDYVTRELARVVCFTIPKLCHMHLVSKVFFHFSHMNP